MLLKLYLWDSSKFSLAVTSVIIIYLVALSATNMHIYHKVAIWHLMQAWARFALQCFCFSCYWYSKLELMPTHNKVPGLLLLQQWLSVIQLFFLFFGLTIFTKDTQLAINQVRETKQNRALTVKTQVLFTLYLQLYK